VSGSEAWPMEERAVSFPDRTLEMGGGEGVVEGDHSISGEGWN
jgi:hypothetical protein